MHHERRQFHPANATNAHTGLWGVDTTLSIADYVTSTMHVSVTS